MTAPPVSDTPLGAPCGSAPSPLGGSRPHPGANPPTRCQVSGTGGAVASSGHARLNSHERSITDSQSWRVVRETVHSVHVNNIRESDVRQTTLAEHHSQNVKRAVGM